MTKSIETIDPSLVASIDDKAVFVLMKMFDNYICRFDSYILIIGKYSGLVTIFNSNNGSFRKLDIVSEAEMPEDPKETVNNGRATAWIGPLMGGETLICCRMWVVPHDKPSPVSLYCFRTLNLKTGKITFHGAEYNGCKSESGLTLFEENGCLFYVRDIIKEREK